MTDGIDSGRTMGAARTGRQAHTFCATGNEDMSWLITGSMIIGAMIDAQEAKAMGKKPKKDTKKGK